MSGTGGPEILEEDVVTEVTPASTALVPVTTDVRWQPKISLPRPDPSFVPQLIATADLAPQTRVLRRGSSADAQAAYGPHISERRSVTRRTRQII